MVTQFYEAIGSKNQTQSTNGQGLYTPRRHPEGKRLVFRTPEKPLHAKHMTHSQETQPASSAVTAEQTPTIPPAIGSVVEFPRDEAMDLRHRLVAHEDAYDSVVAEAAGSPLSMFVLSKIVEAHRLTTTTLAENLKAPVGWLAFARLWRAQLVECSGSVVTPTDRGIALLRWMEEAVHEPDESQPASIAALGVPAQAVVE